MTTDNILAAALGSLFTILLNKVLEAWQRAQDHKYQLKRSFFEKKLAAAESAVSMWYSMSSAYSALSALYERASDLSAKEMGSLFEPLNNSLIAQVQKISESSLLVANTIFLYFDFETDTAKSKEPIKNFYDALTEIKDLTISLDALNQIEKERPSDAFAKEFVDSEKSRIRTQAMEHVNRIKSVFDTVQKDLTQMLKTIRSQMKQFE